MGVVENWLAEHDGGFIFDGFPRTIAQAEALETMLARRGTPLQAAISLDTDAGTLAARMASRLVCLECGQIVAAGLQVAHATSPCPRCGGALGRRADDTPEVLGRRLLEYKDKSEPLVGHYDRRGLLHRVDSSGTPPEVFFKISEILEDGA